MQHTKYTTTYTNHSGGKEMNTHNTLSTLSVENDNSTVEDDPNVSDEDISNTNVNTSIIQTQIDQLFPPRILGYRVSNIAKMFINRVDKAYKESISNLKKQVNSESASESLKAIDTLNNIDYGFQVVIDKIKVNIFVFEETDKGITEYTFDCKKKIGRIKSIAAKMNDYIMPYVTSDNKKYTTVSLEFVVADKLLTNREKDKIDIEKVKECNGMSSEKIKKLPLPVVKEVRLIGDNLEFTSTMPRIKLDVPKKKRSNGFINIGTILLLIAIVVAIVLTNR